MTMLAEISRSISTRRASKGFRRSAIACAAMIVFFAARVTPTEAADKKITYDDNVAAIFRQRCSACHNANSKKADLDVTSYSSLMHGGSSGAVIEPGDADSSYLFLLVTHKSEPYMPQKADKLPDAEIDLIRKWIAGGALENSGSKAAKPKKSLAVAVVGAIGKRPEVMPLPPRMVLEPAFVMQHPPMARSLAASPWAPLVAVASQRQVLLYNTNSLDLVAVFPFPEGQPNVVRFSRDGQLLLAGGGRPAASGKVVVWNITTGERVFEVGNELDAVLAADISADRKRIALGGPQRVVKIFSTETGELQCQMAKHTDWVLAAEFSPDGVLLATADRNGGLCVWESETGHEYLTLTGHSAAVTSLSWRADSNVLASASEDASIRLWEMENGTSIKTWNAKSSLTGVTFTRDSRLVTTGRDQVTRIWNQEGKELAKTPPLGELGVSVAYADESHVMVAASLAGVVQLYKDNGTKQGALITNPPTLENRLAAARKTLQESTIAVKPLADAVEKAQHSADDAQSALSSKQQELATFKSAADQLAAAIKQTTASRAAADAERNKAAASLQQIDAAKPSVAEALRHLTEALGKLPTDAKLAASQHALDDQLQAMNARSHELQLHVTELAVNIAAADAKLKDTQTQLAAITKKSAASADQIKRLEAQFKTQAAALEAARQAARPAEAALDRARRAVARWEDEIAFRDQMALLQSDLEAARKVVADRQSELEKANTQLAAVQKTVVGAKVKVDEATRGVDAVMQKIQQARGKK